MSRRNTLPPGKIGYVGLDDLYSDSRWVPCVKLAFAQSPRDVEGPAIEVRRNPQSGALEVKLGKGVKLPQRPELSLSPTQFNALTLIDELGIGQFITPKKYR